jgi:hypothetical protein
MTPTQAIAETAIVTNDFFLIARTPPGKDLHDEQDSEHGRTASKIANGLMTAARTEGDPGVGVNAVGEEPH